MDEYVSPTYRQSLLLRIEYLTNHREDPCRKSLHELLAELENAVDMDITFYGPSEWVEYKFKPVKSIDGIPVPLIPWNRAMYRRGDSGMGGQEVSHVRIYDGKRAQLESIHRTRSVHKITSKREPYFIRGVVKCPKCSRQFELDTKNKSIVANCIFCSKKINLQEHFTEQKGE